MKKKSVLKKVYCKYIVLILGVLIAMGSCKNIKAIQKAVYFEGYEREKVIFGYEEEKDSGNSELIKDSKGNLIVLTFFNGFNDTIALYYNGVERGKWFIHERNNPNTSSGYSGFDVAILFSKRDNSEMILKLESQKVFISFDLLRLYSYITFQRFNKIWYINYLKKPLILK